MITDYLNQTAQHKVLSATTNLYNEASYAAAVTIAVRKRAVIEKIIDLTDEEIIKSTYIIHTTATVVVGDKIDDMPVLKVTEMVNYAGVTIGVVVYT